MSRRRPEGDYRGGRKRIFIGLLCAACTAVCLLFLVFLILPWLSQDASWLRYVSLGTGTLGIGVITWLCVLLVVHIHTGVYLPGIYGIKHLLIRLLLPLMEIAGRLVGIDKKIVRRSFIRVNNEFVAADVHETPASNILLLLPHCIQASVCPRRLRMSLENCVNCGSCQVGLLKNLANRYGFKIAIATGGTIARRIVVECRPAVIIAVACERDLTSGIQDSYPIPVYGVLNEQPFGPCRDTLAPAEPLLQALAFFLGVEEMTPAQNIARHHGKQPA